MTRSLCILIFFLSANLSAFAETHSEFYIENDLVSKIFRQSLKLSESLQPKGSHIAPMIGFMRAEKLTVINHYFKTDYRQIGTLPYVYLMTEGSLTDSEEGPLLWSFSIGYTYIQKNIITKDVSGLVISDMVSMQWAPVELGFRYKIRNIFLAEMNISFDLGYGRSWFHQNGNVDGFDQGAFYSYASAGSTIEKELSDSLKIVSQISYCRDLKEDVDYRAWRLGVGAWLLI
ncbi:MAG: hypothetical protein H6618_07940 [Deltaproteobacteria bacterium]|nr:hypothetical protein [Deltaproteobacteria bacterium]